MWQSTIVSVLNTGKTHDRVMAKYAQNVFLWLSAFNIDIQVVHTPGKMNSVADLLSRWHKTVKQCFQIAGFCPVCHSDPHY